MLFETFVEEKNVSNFDNFFPEFSLKWVFASRRVAAGRASGGCVYGVRNSVRVNRCVEFVQLSNRDVIKVQLFNECMYVVPIYLNFNAWDYEFKKLYDLLSENSHLRICLMGDFNCRTGDLQKISKKILPFQSAVESFNRNSKDKCINQNGTKMLELLDDFSLVILNGRVKDDILGELTFINAIGSSVIDYVCVSSDAIVNVNYFKVDSQIFSDHLPILLSINIKCEISDHNLLPLPKLIWRENIKQNYQRKLTIYLDNTLLYTNSIFY